MMPYPILDLRSHTLTAGAWVHKRESKLLDDDMKPHIVRNLVHSVADQIVHYKLDTRERDFTIEYRIEVVVMTPNEMARLIQDEAYKMYNHLLSEGSNMP